ncbi:uncharacterized protein LOC114449984 [Parambassis ranga]|uniref:Uncharacterized protein LOC114449984 n=1 Tax=Parambassis ranga TaxID=210632 RepID=A0A6P7K837_9TELE|nr:uncharacterized protein LOC114449984 [Parambassis ranga]
MEKMSLFLVLFLQGLLGTESISVTGVVGKDITISCSHSNAFSNVKYFCKGACSDNDILIISTGKNHDGKYSIKDKGNTFYVTIRHLTDTDSGQYWCGIERTGLDTYNEVLIRVIKGPDDSKHDSLFPETLVYIGASLGVAVLALAIVVLIFFRYRKRQISKFSDTVYATPCIQKQEERRVITTGSADEERDSGGSINSRVYSPPDTDRGHTDGMHNNNPSDPPIRPDDVTYCTVTFNDTRTGCDSTTLHPADVTYSLKHMSTDEATVYSNYDCNDCKRFLILIMRILIVIVIVCLMTASVSLGAKKKNKSGSNINCENAENQAARVEGSVSISCKYPQAEKNNIRYFCRKDGNLSCTSVLTQQDRFSLTDNEQKSTYTVVISSLAQEDAGTYRCALKRVDDNSTACLKEIHLHVLDWDDIIPTKADVTSDTAIMTCKYSDSNKQSEKILCKGDKPLECKELIRTTRQDKDVVNGRFNIRDNQRKKYFYVYIQNLTRADSGVYWCGAGAEYTKIQLSVDEKYLKVKKRSNREEDKSNQPTVGYKNGPAQGPMIGGIVAAAVLLLVAVILLIIFRRKIFRRGACCAAGDSSEQKTDTGHNTEGENNADHQYEEIHLQLQQQASAPLSVYATVNPPADLVHYASVDFQNNADSVPDTNRNGSSAVSGGPPESTLYSTVSATQPK